MKQAILLSALAAASLAVPTRAQTEPLFGLPTWGIANSLDGLTTGDLDGDGLADVATCTQTTDTVTVLLATPGGMLKAAGTHSVASWPRVITDADFDGDGTSDLATANDNGHSISFLGGLGGGAFAPHIESPALLQATTLLAADLDGDGDQDLATVSLWSYMLASVLGAGDGTFVVASLAYAGEKPQDLTLADFDGDGVLDAAAVNEVVGVTVLRGDGSGGFLPGVAFASGYGPATIANGDADLDGDVDLATADYSGQAFSVLPGDGSGAFPSHLSFPAGDFALAVEVADVSGDGLPDLVGALSAGIGVLKGLGGGDFAAPQTCGTLPLNGLELDDFDGDGHQDAVLVNTYGMYPEFLTFSLAHNDGDGSFGGLHATQITYGGGASGLGDFDGDGRLDAVASTWMPGGFVLLRGDGQGNFVQVDAATTGADPTSVAVQDVDQDGELDLVTVAGAGYGVLTFVPGGGDGTLGTPTSSPIESYPADVVLADLDGDGTLDAAITSHGLANVVSVLHGFGDGSFGPPTDFSANDNPDSPVTADVDGDGDLDIVTGSSFEDAGTMAVLAGAGDGTFPTASAVMVGGGASGLAVADFNQDGDPDIAAVVYSDNKAVVLRGQAGAGFSVSGLPIGPGPVDLAAGDLDGDGVPDFACGLSTYGTVVVRRGLGDGTFVAAGGYAAHYPSSLSLGDVVLDGRLDIVSGYGEVVTLVNHAPSAWGQVGHALDGVDGAPVLYGEGSLAGGSANGLHLAGAAPLAPLGMFVGTSQALLPFKGGTLVPQPTLLVVLPTGPAGMVDIPFVMPAGVPSGVPLVLQAWIADAAGPKGFAASNGLVGTVP